MNKPQLEILIWDLWILDDDGFTRVGSITNEDRLAVERSLHLIPMGSALVWC